MVTGTLRRDGDRYVVDVPREEVERLHLREGLHVTLELSAVELDCAPEIQPLVERLVTDE